MKKEPRTVSIYLRPALETELEARGDNRNHVIHRDLERLYTLYRLALREMTLTLPEAWFIVDMLNGSLVDAYSAGRSGPRQKTLSPLTVWTKSGRWTERRLWKN